MKRKHYYYFELSKGDGYLLYDGESLIKLDSPLSIGNEREVKNAVAKLDKDAIVTYCNLRNIDIRSDKILFDFKRTMTIDYAERNKKKTE
jgi:hypothetical protein